MADSVWTWLWRLSEELYDMGEEDISDKIDNFSSLAYEKDQKQVELAFPELIAFARARQNKWLEIYLRHWRLQAYVNTNHDPRPLVPEVLDLLAFANEEDTKDCPQSTCVIDDITDIYAAIDAPGFALERRAMLEETLANLSPHIECYNCITMSLVDALNDQNEFQLALDAFEVGKRKSSMISEDGHFFNYLSPLVMKSLIGTKQYQRALDIAERSTPPNEDGRCSVWALEAQALTGLSNDAHAITKIDQVLAQSPDHINVAELVCAVRDLSSLHTRLDITEKLNELAQLSLERGRMREGFDAAALAFECASGQNRHDLAAHAVTIMENTLPHLNRELGAADRLRRVQAELQDT